jgi:hypothetical protein
VTIGLLPISDGVALVEFGRSLEAQLARFGRACVVDATWLDRALGTPGVALRDDADADHSISLALDRLEAKHDFVLLLADGEPNPWTRRCIRNSDEMLLVRRRCTRPNRLAWWAGRLAAKPPKSWSCCIRPSDPARAGRVNGWRGGRWRGTCTCGPNWTATWRAWRGC